MKLSSSSVRVFSNRITSADLNCTRMWGASIVDDRHLEAHVGSVGLGVVLPFNILPDRTFAIHQMVGDG